jgi:hypothetical protein
MGLGARRLEDEGQASLRVECLAPHLLGEPVAYIADCHSTPESGVPIRFASITPTTALST